MKPLVYRKAKRVRHQAPVRIRLRVTKGDTVQVVSGEDKGKRGRVLRVHPKTGRVTIEGVNIVKRHRRATQTTEAGIVAALKTCWTPTSTYTDPSTNTTHGPVELARAILSFHKSLPGATLKPTSGLDTHHTFGRFSWRLTMPAPVVVNGVQQPQESDGFDFIEFSADGTKIMRIVGFFGPFPKP